MSVCLDSPFPIDIIPLAMSASSSTVDFSTGSVSAKIIAFAFPLFLGNLFQQLYNAADTLIVGNFLGPEALAALSSSGSLIFMLVGFFNGMAVGAGVVISHAFGAGDKERTERAIHSDIAFGIIAGIAITLFAVIFTPSILRWISTPESLLPLSSAYFRIYSAGIFFSVMYNILMGIMNALGDSRHPLYYLIISSVINIVLDLLFIAGFKMGVGSAAFATIISQAVSSILCFMRLVKGEAGMKIKLKAIHMDRKEMRGIITYGLPSGLQNSIIGFANTVVQASVNTFPSAAIAGFGVYGKIEGFVLLPITTLSLALTTFTAQTMGAGNFERTRSGIKTGMFMDVVSGEILGILLYITAPFLVSLFSSDPEVIMYGTKQSRIEALFYFLPAISHASAGILRGAGKAFVPMLVLLSAWCIFRVIFVRIVLLFSHSIMLIYIAYPVTWVLSSIIFIVYLFRGKWFSRKILVS